MNPVNLKSFTYAAECVLKWEMRSRFGINGQHWRCGLSRFDALFNHGSRDASEGDGGGGEVGTTHIL